jgi:hypothetical protein
MLNCLVRVSETVALIYCLNGECWSIDAEKLDQTEKCPAPQLYNIRMHKFFEEIKMDDKYPFDKVRQLLEKKSYQSSMLNSALTCMDKEMPMDLRKTFAQNLKRLPDKAYEVAFEWVSNMMLNTPLPKEADINKEIFDCLSEKFQELFRQIFQKYRGVDISKSENDKL